MKATIAVPCIILLLGRAISRRSLTPTGVLLAAITATIHALHPSHIPFTLLGIFFLLGTTATKVKHEVKAKLTLSASGDGGGEGPRGAIQVLANSGVASLLCCLHVLKFESGSTSDKTSQKIYCFGTATQTDLLMLGIVANYAAVTADTLSSELGILAKGSPRLITTGKSVPPGTNGGVTLTGLLAGAAGAAIIGALVVSLSTFCNDVTVWDLEAKAIMWVAITVWGALGSLLDSWLGAVLQASVVDRRTGKVVEGAGGKRVLVVDGRVTGPRKEAAGHSRSIGSGRDILDNNQINVLMATIMSVGGMWAGGAVMGIELSSLWR